MGEVNLPHSMLAGRWGRPRPRRTAVPRISARLGLSLGYWSNARDQIYFWGYGIPYIYGKKDPFFFLGQCGLRLIDSGLERLGCGGAFMPFP